jgi:hypothetical protein
MAAVSTLKSVRAPKLFSALVTLLLLLGFGFAQSWAAAPSFLSKITDFSVKENSKATNLSFLIWDTDTNASKLRVTVSSTNTTLLPVANLVVSGTTSNRTLRVTPAANQYGTSEVTLTVTDPEGGTDTDVFVVTVLLVNQAPKVAFRTNKVVALENAGLVTVPNFVASRSAGPASESGQTMTLTLYYTNSFFDQAPAIDSSGTLTFQSASNQFGNTVVRVAIRDDGGTANGGVDGSTNSFNLSVLAVNHPPSFAFSSNLVVRLENAGAVSIPGFLTDLSAGPSSESKQNWTFKVLSSSGNPTNVAYATAPTLTTVRKTNATLAFKSAVNSFGTNTLTVIMTDGGGTANGGVNSFTNQFLLGVSWVDQAPRILGATNRTMLEDHTLSSSVTVVDVDTAGTSLALSASTTNTSLLDVSVTGPDSTGATNASFTLVMAPKTNANGTATIVLVADDGIKQTTNKFVLTVTAVNDPPSYVVSTDPVRVDENSGARTITNFLTGLSAGPGNESKQSWNFKLYSTTNLATNVSFAVFPSLRTVRTNAWLTFRPATNSYGTNTITVVMTDAGGTNFGGVSSFTNTFQIEVAHLNQPPYIVGATNRSILENQPKTVLLSTYDVDSAGSEISLTALVTNSLADVTISGPTNVGASNAVFIVSFTPATNANGTEIVKLVADDGVASRTNQFTLTVLAVNNPPSFDMASNVVEQCENAGATTITNFLTGLSAGPDNEKSQTWVFTLKTSTNQASNAKFLTMPAIKTVGTNGWLYFKTATNSFGTNDVTLIMTDNGGTNYGGVASFTNTFQIQVPWSNQPPFIAWATNRVVNENQTTNLSFQVCLYDSDSALSALSLSVDNTNTDLLTVAVGGSQTVNATNKVYNLNLTLANNANGVTYVNFTADDGVATRTNTMKIIVNPVDQPPSFTLSNNVLQVWEGGGLVKLTNFITGVSAGPSNEYKQTLTFTVNTATNQSTNVLFKTYPAVVTNSAYGYTTNAILTFESATNCYGTNTVWVVLKDNGVPTNGGCNVFSNWFQLQVMHTNQAPYFLAGMTNRTWLEDSTSNATAVVTAYDIDTPGSSLGLSASSSYPALLDVAVTATNNVGVSNADFTLSFTLGSNMVGKAVISVVAGDGIARRTNSFTVTVNQVNHAPHFDLTTNLVRIARNMGPFTWTNFLTNCTAGPSNEYAQSWTFTLYSSTNDATNVTFQTFPRIGTNNVLSLQTATNACGTNTVTVLMRDNGGNAYNGVNVYSNDFLLEVYWVPDTPMITGATNFTLLENAVSNLTMDVQVFTPNTNGSSLHLTASVDDITLADVVVASPQAVTESNAVFTITFQPVADSHGAGVVTLVADDGVSSVTNTISLTVAAVNQQPYFDLITTELVLNENSGGVSITNFADNMSVGPDNESGQIWSFMVTNQTPGATNVLFSVSPGIATNGTLSFRTRTNSYGTNLYAVIMTDSGGTNNGGVNKFTNYFLLSVCYSNQAPWIISPGSQTLLENGSTNLSVVVYDFDGPGNGITLSASTTNTSLVSLSVTGPNTVGATNATFTLNVNPMAHANGKTTVVLVASDGESSRTNSFLLTVSSVNDAPSFQFATNELVVAQNSGEVSLANFVTNISVGPANESGQTWTFTVECDTSDPTNVLFDVPPAVATNGTLTFTLSADSFGTNTVTVIMQDGGGTANDAVDTFTNTFLLEVADGSSPAAVAIQLARAPAASARPFEGLKGAYAGIFLEANTLSGRSSGYLGLQVDGEGNFSGCVMRGGLSNAVSGQFKADGGLVSVHLPDGATLSMSLGESVQGGGTVAGSVSSPEGWSSALLALPSIGLSDVAGSYALGLSSAEAEAGEVLRLVVDSRGAASLAVSIQGGAAVVGSSLLCQEGWLPVYVPLGDTSSLSGWLQWGNAGWQGSLLLYSNGSNSGSLLRVTSR